MQQLYPTPEIERVLAHVSTWPGVDLRMDSDGSVEFAVDGVVAGSAHGDVVDLAFSPSVRDQLLTEGRADRYRTDPRSSWVSVRARTPEDLHDVRWLLRLAYLCRLAGSLHDRGDTTLPTVDLHREFDRLDLSTSLRLLVSRTALPSPDARQSA
ncbi:hypothetical protein SAMN04487950_2839 [Halogranum rubrum]|uniref:Luciferase domain-containing protein n=1 Tax=Halogranum rubrum TaxID=553466 RepID=A0A1I4FH10_9EURY|nr:luciferase family protein [Halogranum rubrum]SFL16733.1 hypothetical protein SAMN04487950_2839 [Halogranum rubrum]